MNLFLAIAIGFTVLLASIGGGAAYCSRKQGVEDGYDQGQGGIVALICMGGVLLFWLAYALLWLLRWMLLTA